MRRMNGMDAYYVHTDQLNAVQHTLKIAILDPSTAPGGWNYAEFREILRAMPRLLPWTRWKYLSTPLSLQHPVWVDDPAFDIDYHLRHVACPTPGDNRALCEIIAGLYITPLDHRRPLWMVWTIEGLAGGKVANVMLLHHAYADGPGASLIMQQCYKPKPFRFALKPRDWAPTPLPTRLKLIRQALRELPVTIGRAVPKAVGGLVQTRKLAKRYVAEGRKAPPNPFSGMPDSPSNALLSGCRSFAFETWELARVRALSKHFGVTINDLFVACAAWVYRRFLLDRRYDADAGPLVASIPLSRRPPPEIDDGLGNYTMVDYLHLPVHIAEPMARLTAAREAGNLMKEHYREAEGADFASLLDLMPAAAIRATIRRTERMRGKGGLGGNAVISNVPGPKETLYLGPIKLDNWLSTGQIVQGLAVNLTAWSYAGKFNLCVLADKKVLPDGWSMIDWFDEALKEYDALAASPVKPAPSAA